MRHFNFIIIILIAFNSFGQIEDYTKYQDTVFIRYNKDQSGNTLKYGTDTVIFPSEMRRHLLKGTTILPYTHNQQCAKGYGIYFDKVTLSDCRRDVTEYGGYVQEHINYINITDSTLQIDFNLFDNCCYSFLCDISIIDESILNLIYTGYGTYCDCDCCFGLNYQMSLIKDENFSKIKYMMINGNNKTKRKFEFSNKK